MSLTTLSSYLFCKGTQKEIAEAVSTVASRAALKLRRQVLATAHLSAFA